MAEEPVKPPQEFEKEVVRLPDGRELTFYRFPEPPPARKKREPVEKTAADGERRPRRMSLGRPASGPPMRSAASPRVRISSEQGAWGSGGSPGEAPGSRRSPIVKEQ